MPTERLLPNERLTVGTVPRGCLECGAQTWARWCGLAFCSLECVEDFAQEFAAEYGDESPTPCEQHIDAAPPVPAWWPTYLEND